MIQLHNVTLAYQHDASALNNITLKIAKGEFVFLTGPSGAGKTTLLRLLYGALTPNRGQVIIDGQNITRLSPSQIPLLRRSIGVVFQDFKLLQNRTVFENVAITLEVLGWGRVDIGKKTMHILKQMGIESKYNLVTQRLSGGEQQRVALARALVNDPKILLADEPTGNLDEANKNQILNIFKEANIRGTTVVVATHDRRLIEQSHFRLETLIKGELLVEQVEKEKTRDNQAI
jgi:cell division transport system ATP-binding protein